MNKQEYKLDVVKDAKTIQRAMTDKRQVVVMDILIHAFKAHLNKDHDYSMKVEKALEEIDLNQVDFILEGE